MPVSGDRRFDYDWVVIGSGFGGNIAALRLAQKGYSVAVLEEGRRFQPEDFPKTSWNLRRYAWQPGLGCRGILRMRRLRDVLALSGAGVGGGSLVYGNTLIEPIDSFYDVPMIRELGGARALRPYFALAKKMLGVAANPHLTEPNRLLRETAEEYGRGHTFAASPVGVFFGEPGVESPDPYFHGEGPARTGCTLCGGCFIGCRVGAKNTLDLNYLYFAERFGCAILPETRATAIRALSQDGSDGYAIDTLRAERWNGRRRGVLRARGVVVAAGVLGSLELLLSCKDQGQLAGLSDRLGYGVRTNSESILAITARRRDVDHSRGIAASSSVFPDDHTQIQADRYPDGSDMLGLMSTLLVDGGGRVPRPLRFLGALLRHPADFARTLRPFGFARRSVILVVMQDHDSSLRIARRRRRLWPFSQTLDSRPQGDRFPTYLPIANDFARRMAGRMDGIPRSSISEVFLGAPVSAHILGGCSIGKSAEDAVLDHRQRAFGYRNLMVCDGSVIPANLGVNPALSIAAFAERALSFVPPKPGATVRQLAVEKDWGVERLLQR